MKKKARTKKFRKKYLRQPSIDFDFCNISSSCDVVYKGRSCGTVALYGPLYIYIYIYIYILRTIGLRFSLYQKLSKLRKKNLAPLFCQFLSLNRVRERSNIYISFR